MPVDAGTMTVRLNMDTKQFDRTMRRVTRKLKRIQIRSQIFSKLWLWTYAAAMTGATIALAAIDLAR